jgi:hypothetical protein
MALILFYFGWVLAGDRRHAVKVHEVGIPRLIGKVMRFDELGRDRLEYDRHSLHANDRNAVFRNMNGLVALGSGCLYHTCVGLW